MAVILEIYFKIAVCGIASVFGLDEHDKGVCRSDINGTVNLNCCPGYQLTHIAFTCEYCPNGTYGINCGKVCESTHYGMLCQSSCDCKSNETCDAQYGCVGPGCPNGTYGYKCGKVCDSNHYGFLCQSTCDCNSNETCHAHYGCVGHDFKPTEENSDDDNNTALICGVVVVVLVLIMAGITSAWKFKKKRFFTHGFNIHVTRRFNECRPANSYEISTGDDVSVEQRLYKDFVRSFENTPYDEQSIYYEIRESMMVRPTTVSGRQLSIIRTSCIDNSVDQYEHVQLSLERLDLNSVQTEEQNTENSSEDEIKRIPNEYATLVKNDNHDLPDADDNKEYDKLYKLEFDNYETEVSIEKPHSNGYVFMEEDIEECNSENLPELQLSHSSFVSSEECDNDTTEKQA